MCPARPSSTARPTTTRLISPTMTVDPPGRKPNAGPPGPRTLAAQRHTISRGTARCPSTAFQDPGSATVFFMCPARPSSTARRRPHLLLDPDSVRADRQPGPSARHSASPEQVYCQLAIDCFPALWPSDDTFHVSCTAVTQWRIDDHICCWILNSDWKPALRTHVLQLEIPWRGRAPKLSTIVDSSTQRRSPMQCSYRRRP